MMKRVILALSLVLLSACSPKIELEAGQWSCTKFENIDRWEPGFRSNNGYWQKVRSCVNWAHHSQVSP